MNTLKALLSDFSWVLLHPKDRNYTGSLNGLNRQHGGENGMGEYPFFEYFELNTELLEYYKKLKQQYNLHLYMFTTDIIQERPEINNTLKTVFERIISGREIVQKGVSKAETLDAVKLDPKSYEFIAQDLNLQPTEILFIDDKEKNLEAARIAGYKTILYPKLPQMHESNQTLITELNLLFK